jgi:DNA ligase (NAD+)
MEVGTVKGIVDIYRLNTDSFKDTDIGDKVTENVLKAIEEGSKGVRLGKFISALGIPGAGKSTSEALSNHIGSAEKLLDLKFSDLVGLPDAGEKTMLSILQYLSDADVKNTIQILVSGTRLSNPYITFEKGENMEGKKVFVITGTLSVGRKEFSALITKAGGVMADSISKKVNYLVAGEDCGSKLEKAKKLGIQIMTESEARVQLRDMSKDLQ